MVIDARSAADEIGAALETGRRELAKVDLEKVRDDALSAARSALPANLGLHMPRRQRRRRWPLVAVLLALAGAALGWAFLPGVKARLGAAIGDRRRPAVAATDQDLVTTLDAEVSPEVMPEMASSPA
jgi:ferric-dicitrate binding protein FerR (iron transport regulator)